MNEMFYLTTHILVRWVVGSILHGVDPLSYFSFQPVLHDWCNKGRGMCYPVCGMVHIKEPLLLIEKSSPSGGSGFPLSLSELSFTICLTPYNRKVLSASLNKTFPSLKTIQQHLKQPRTQFEDGVVSSQLVNRQIMKIFCHIAILNTFI